MVNIIYAIKGKFKKRPAVRAVNQRSYEYGSKHIELNHLISDLGIMKMGLPSTFVSGRQKFVQDRCRSCSLKLTAEEIIRQKTVMYLISNLLIPLGNIKTEDSMRHHKVDNLKRMDILVRIKGINGEENLLLIECKHPHVWVVGEPLQQVLRYHEHLNRHKDIPKYIMVTNGTDSLMYHFDANKNVFEALEELPVFKKMLAENHLHSTALPEKAFQRPQKRSNLGDQELLRWAEDEGIVYETTNSETAALILNLYFCLLDPKEFFQSGFSGKTFTLVEDFRLADHSVGNPSGGRYDATYRWLKVKDRNRHIRNIYISVCNSLIIVAIERNTTPISVLQISMDRSAAFSDDLVEITHDGRKSQMKNRKVLDYVKRICPDLLRDEDTVLLGTLDNNELFTLKGASEERFFASLIDYSLLRFELHEKRYKSQKSYQLRKKKMTIPD